MRQWLRSHLTYANVMVTILAFIVLGGGSAVALNGNNTVFTDDIVNDEVYSLDVRNDTLGSGGLAAVDLRPNSVGQSEIAAGGVGTGEVASSVPAARVTHSAAQSITDATTTTLSFDTERYDTASVHDNVTNNSRLTAPVAGIYNVTANIRWAGNGTGTRGIQLLKNGLTELASDNVAPGWANPAGQTITTVARLAAGDYVEARVVQTSGGALDVEQGNERTPEFSMTWLAPGP